MTKSVSTIGLTLLIIVIALAVRVTTLGHTFIVNDETLYWQWSNQFTLALLNGDWAGTIVGKGYPSVTVFWVHALGLAVARLIWGAETAQTWLTHTLIFDMLGQRRLIMAVINALLFGPIFWQARQLLGTSRAFWGSLFMTVTPFLLADSRTMRGDALMCSLMIISLLGFLLYLRDNQRGQLLSSGVSFGLAFLTKITAIPLVGLVGLATLVYFGRQTARPWLIRLKQIGLTLLMWGTIAGLTIVALWPALWVAPFEVVDFMTSYAADSIDGRLNYFWGELTHDEPLHLFYPVAFLFRATPLMVGGLLILAGLLIHAAWQRQRPDFLTAGNTLNGSVYWTVLALLAYSLIYWLVLDFGALKRDRYLMPIFPAMALLTGVGWLWLINRLAKISTVNRLPQGWRLGWLLFGLTFSLELGHIVTTHPYYYTYWNPTMGGGRLAEFAMMAESGVDSVPFVTLSQRPQAEQETIAILTTRDYKPAYVGQTVRMLNTDPWVTANFVVLRQYHYQTEKFDPHILEYLYRQPPVQILDFQGYRWAWVYPGPAAQYYAGSLLDGEAQLLGYNVNRDEISLNQPLRVTLYWENKGLQPTDQIFVHLVDASGFTWLATTAQPLPEFASVAHRLEAIVESEAELPVLPGTPPGVYYLKIGVANDGREVGQFTLPAEGNRISIDGATQVRSNGFSRSQLAEAETTNLHTESQTPNGQVRRLPMTHHLDQPLNDELTLVGFNWTPAGWLTRQNPQPMTFYWQATRPITADYAVSVSLLTEAGHEVAYWLNQPTRGIYPPSAWQRADLVRDPWLLDLNDATWKEPQESLPAGNYTLQLTVFNSLTETMVSQLPLTEIQAANRQRLFEVPPLEHSVGAKMGEAITLLGYEANQRPLTGAARLKLTLYWQADQPIPTDYTVFVQMLGPTGTVIGQHDAQPINNSWPTTNWQAGEVVADPHQIEFPTTQPGDYRLIVGLYEASTGQRLPVFQPDGSPAGDFWQLFHFTVTND